MSTTIVRLRYGGRSVPPQCLDHLCPLGLVWGWPSPEMHTSTLSQRARQVRLLHHQMGPKVGVGQQECDETAAARKVLAAAGDVLPWPTGLCCPPHRLHSQSLPRKLSFWRSSKPSLGSVRYSCMDWPLVLPLKHNPSGEAVA